MAAPIEPASSQLRLTVVIVVVTCLFATLLARLWFLQVINAPVASHVTQQNGVRIITTEAPRGRILDRNGNVLVGNVDEPVIEVQRQQMPSGSSVQARLAALMGVTVPVLQSRLHNTQYAPYVPVPVFPDPSAAQILYIQEHQALFPGVTATTLTVRQYSPMGVAAANIVGYVGQITSGQLLKAKGYQPGDQIGLSGVEATYESVLRGQPGERRVQVNAKGQELSTISDTSPVQGHDLKLTIDGIIQQVAVGAVQQGLGAARSQFDTVTKRNFSAPAGSAVVEDPRDGSVIALATYPDYDPSKFVGGISDADYAQLKDPAANNPLLDRAIQGAYAPGSTFKMVTATAALEAGLTTPGTVFPDTGSIKIGNQVFHNDNGEVLGPITLPTAITKSSDIYFNSLGADFWNARGRLGEDALQNVAQAYGFGKRTGIALPDETPGLIPTPKSVAADYKAYPKLYETGTWYTGDSAQMAIGQFEDLVTPLQLANAYAGFANGGTIYQPRLASVAQTQGDAAQPPQVVQTFAPKVNATVSLSPADHAAMVAGFEGVVNNPQGTAYNDFYFPGSKLEDKDIAGKTGTAQVTAAGKQNTSVFTSFAPASAPVYEVTALLEDSGYGASIAAPVVRQIYDALYGLPLQPVSAVQARGAAT